MSNRKSNVKIRYLTANIITREYITNKFKIRKFSCNPLDNNSQMRLSSLDREKMFKE